MFALFYCVHQNVTQTALTARLSKRPHICVGLGNALGMVSLMVNVNMSYCASANCHFYYLSECMGHCSGKWLLHDQSHKKEMLLCKGVLIE